MYSSWSWYWSTWIWNHLHHIFKKYVGFATFLDKLHHRSLKFFISIEISWIEPLPLYPYLYSHSFKIIFIISSRFDFLHMLAPCLLLCIDLLFSRIEFIFFLDVKLKVIVFENLHLLFEYSKKLLNLFHANHVLRSNLHLNILIFILNILKEGKCHCLLLLEIDLWSLNVSLHLLTISCIYFHNPN